MGLTAFFRISSLNLEANQAQLLRLEGGLQTPTALRVRLLQSGAQEIVAPDSTEELRIRVDSLLQNQTHNHSLNIRILELNRELEALTYSISHDLRAPLRAVNGFSDALISDYGEVLPPEGRRLLERIHSNAERLSQMMEDLLELSRLAREPLQSARLDVTALIGQLAAQLRHGQPSRSVELVVADGLSAWGDARLLKRLWENLLDNAWKFTAPQARPLVEVGQVDGVFFVRDNGVGYDMQYADRLFAPFQRLHGRDYAGRGVGLAAAARVVARHGGKIWAEAAVGKGATIFLTLATG